MHIVHIIGFIVRAQFGIGLVVNAALYVPQILRILQTKATGGLSLIMFFGFWLLTLSQVVYGFYIGDRLLAWGTGITLITCGVVIWLILIYRKNI